ncbi:hypothetical protein D3C75_796660 [compost metagenome]
MLGAGAAVLVPDIHGLAVLDKGRKAFAQPVDQLAYAKLQLLTHVSFLRAFLDIGHGFGSASCQPFITAAEFHLPFRAFPDMDGELSAIQRCLLIVLLDPHKAVFTWSQLECGLPLRHPCMMDQPDPDHPGKRRMELNCQQHGIQHAASSGDRAGGSMGGQPVSAALEIMGLSCALYNKAVFYHPVPVRKFHCCHPTLPVLKLF